MKNASEQELTEEELADVAAYGEVLRDIHARLARDGYFLTDGRTWNIFKCCKPQGEFVVEWEDSCW